MLHNKVEIINPTYSVITKHPSFVNYIIIDISKSSISCVQCMCELLAAAAAYFCTE